MSEIKDFKDLIAWQKAMSIAKNIFIETKQFPKEEIYGLTSQLSRAAVSVSANIAEGYGRNSTGEYIQFLGISKGSLSELETLVILSHEFEYLDQEKTKEIISQIHETYKILNGLIKSLKR